MFNEDNTEVGFYTLALTVTTPLSTLPAIIGTTYFKQFATQPRIPSKVLKNLDGYISIVAALCAVRLCPRVRDVLFLSHASYEIGYRLAARKLGLEPCLLLGMRLGEGSGCPLLFRVMQGACAVLNHMATFPEAAIEDGYLAPIRQGDAFTVDKS